MGIRKRPVVVIVQTKCVRRVDKNLTECFARKGRGQKIGFPGEDRGGETHHKTIAILTKIDDGVMHDRPGRQINSQRLRIGHELPCCDGTCIAALLTVEQDLIGIGKNQR